MEDKNRILTKEEIEGFDRKWEKRFALVDTTQRAIENILMIFAGFIFIALTYVVFFK